jgi:predicted ribosome quality control (RQC) complex YloA/Tae2 family protein
MLSLKEVRRAADSLAARLSGTRLQRIVQADDFRLIMEFCGQSETHVLLLSCRPQFARISSLREMPKAASSPPAFAQYLKAHFDRAAFERVTTSPHDRRLGIRLNGHSGAVEIVLSILGPRSNIYLLDQHGVLLYAMRPLAQTRRTLSLGRPWVDPEGGPKSEGSDRWEHMPDPGYLGAIEETYADLERKEETEVLARRIELVLKKEVEFLERKAVNLLQDLGEAVQAEDYRHKGEMLKLVLHTIRPGADSVTVSDYETGAQVVIPLDPRLPPAENLAAYFKRYQKELRGAKALQEQLENLRNTQEEIAGFQHRLERMLALPDLAALQALAAEPRVRKLLSRQYPDRKMRPGRQTQIFPGKKEIPSRLLPKRYKTEQGLEIWVGRSEEGNDYLSTRLARGNDLFFHLEGYPGSHVILRTGGNVSPPSESVLSACELAVHFSKMKEARQADVHVAPIKNVKKPKGAKPGLVYVTGGKTIHLRRDPKRLENILATRLEE